MIHDLLTTLHSAGVTTLDLDPAHNRLRCLPTTPAALRPLLAQRKAALLGLAHGEGRRIPLRAAPGSNGYSYGEVEYRNGATGWVVWDDALDLVLADFSTADAAKAYAEQLHAAALTGAEGVSHAD